MAVEHRYLFGVSELWDAVHIAAHVVPLSWYTGHEFCVPFRISRRIEYVLEAKIVVALKILGISVLLKENRGNEMICVEVASVMIG